MAKQVGPLYITGKVGDMVFYKLNGQYICRRKSQLINKDRIYNDPAYATFRQNAAIFALSVKITNHVYKHLSKAQRVNSNYRTIIKKTISFLKQKTSVKRIIKTLFQQYGVLAQPTSAPTTAPVRVSRIAMTNSKRTFLREHEIAALQNNSQPLAPCVLPSGRLLPQAASYSAPNAYDDLESRQQPRFALRPILHKILVQLQQNLMLPPDILQYLTPAAIT